MGTFGQFANGGGGGQLGKRLTLLAAALIPPEPPAPLQLPYVLLDFDTTTTNTPPDVDDIIATTPPSDIWAMLESGTLTMKDMPGYEAHNRQARHLARRLGIEAKAYCGFCPDDDGVDDSYK